MEKFKVLLQETNKKTFLDIGTGAGNFVDYIKEIYKDYEKIVGIDVFDKAIDAANKRNEDEKVFFEVMDASNISYPDDSFDVVCLSNSLHHLEDIPFILNEMKRVLKEDGFIIINEMINNDLDAMQLSHMKLHHFSAKIDRILGDTHFDTFSKDVIIQKLQNGTNLHIKDSWYLDVERRKENSKEELDYIGNIMDRVLSRVPQEQREEFQKEANEIKQYINNNGYYGCTSLMVILTK